MVRVISIHSVAHPHQVLTLAGVPGNPVVVGSHQTAHPDDRQRWTMEPWHDNLGHGLYVFKNIANNEYLALSSDYMTIITMPGRFGWTLRLGDSRSVLYDENYTHLVLELSGGLDNARPTLAIFNKVPNQEWDFISA